MISEKIILETAQFDNNYAKIFKIIKNEKIEKIKEMIEKVDYKRFRKDLSYKNYTVK